ncbi:TetR/AcrR family transcriptional regulator [Halomonas elongata]|uniref:TetR family transcription regulator n=2 Tax=Halomonas elongata TaxID=2746 RepID=E1VCJ6_HALED|nr:TetR/AcrR family transcriptional regulator [Halomonas elongata]MDL4863788.1 TetR/AcrR family transcriptional regulator [Halomonas elongata]OBX36543.1 HTH-type transcriptional regulator RutR [Halomonas elongata]RAW08909.1 TetR/AcrR family transcriptional regulator [Halomonas elongata]WBF19634.1 TetR/AcrR family transcriptional regulator [Halomonas elongata]WPU48499.1 TetR/AcrR family transcriptional regulator [Halomonas elongata DSM 2581]
MAKAMQYSEQEGGAIRQRNEKAIMAAAERVFARHGYRGASLQEIAEQAELPKSNVLYYMGSKRKLYVRLLERMMARWNAMLDDISAEDDPAEVLSAFIRSKMQMSRRHPEGSRLFASEILGGAPFLQEYLRGELREWVQSRAAVFREWAERGLMDPVDPVWLIFLIWSSTQHYADFEAQVLGITGREALGDDDLEEITRFLTRVVLKGCGVRHPEPVT